MNTTLGEYSKIARSLDCSVDDFSSRGEWHYIQSDIEKNKDLLKNLSEANLLKTDVRAIDCGIGLGTTFFDLYLQSRELEYISFSFTGVEKSPKYLEFLQNNLLHLWQGGLELIQSDIRDIDYSKYNFIWIFQPFKIASFAMPFYQKVISQAKSGTLIFGIDEFNVINYGTDQLKEEFKKHNRVRVDDWRILQIS